MGNPQKTERLLGPGDLVYIPVCVIGAAVALFFFWRDLNMSLARFNEEQVGVVTYKTHSSQRRLADRLLWDRLRLESPVYDGDYIRTAGLSELTVTFFNGALVSLSENSLIRVTRFQDEARLELDEGNLSASSGAGVIRIESGDSSVRAEGGSSVQTQAVSGSLEVRVLEGRAEIERGENRIDAEAGAFVPAGTAATVEVSPLPPENARVLNGPDGTAAVSFAWQNPALGETMVFEIAADSRFERIVHREETGGGTAYVALEAGRYYWRNYSPSEDAQTATARRFTVLPGEAPRPVSPGPAEEYPAQNTETGIRFQWTSCKGASAYLLEISRSADMADPLYSSQIQDYGGGTVMVSRSGLEEGQYYWRVSPLYPGLMEGKALSSPAAAFRVGKKAEHLEAPNPSDKREPVYLEAENPLVYFSWNQLDGAVSYTFVLSSNEDLSMPILEKAVTDNFCVVDTRAEKLSPGAYFWGISQTAPDKSRSSLSRPSVLAVVAGSPPPRVTEERQPVQPLAQATQPPPTVPPTAPLAAQVQAALPPPATQSRSRSESRTESSPPPTTPLAAQVQAALPPPATQSRSRSESRTESSPPPPPVAPPEPTILPAPENLRPASGFILTEAGIIRDRMIRFAWNSVPGASSYAFALYFLDGEKREEILRREIRAAAFELTDLSILDAGEFEWQVESRGVLEGQSSSSRFTVDIPRVEAARTRRQSGAAFGEKN